MNINPGYALTIHSWENDADNPREQILYGLKKDDVKFYIALLKQFVSGSNGNEGCYGNTDVCDLLDATIPIVRAYNECAPESAFLKTEVIECLNNSNWAHDFLLEVIDSWCEGDYWRVFERAEIHYIPQECEDCTSEFI